MVTSNTTRFTLRVDSQIYEQIKKSSIENKRSINKEIEYSLAKVYSNPCTLTTK